MTIFTECSTYNIFHKYAHQFLLLCFVVLYFSLQWIYINNPLMRLSLVSLVVTGTILWMKWSWMIRVNDNSTLRRNVIEREQHAYIAGCKVNLSPPGQNGRHFTEVTFKSTFLNENIRLSITISLKFVPQGSINNIPADNGLAPTRRQAIACTNNC